MRAWPGGLGDCKVGGNYAPTIRPQQEAAQAGYAQVLWLLNDGKDDCATEVGTMNLFVFLRNEAGEDELVTPPLDGTILPGVTRDSALALARQWGEFKVSERKLTMTELTTAIDENRVRQRCNVGESLNAQTVSSDEARECNCTSDCGLRCLRWRSCTNASE